MQSKSLKISLMIIIIMVMSCDEPETLLTNYVHPDGSVTRRIEMRNVTSAFDPSKFQLPVDSSWNTRDSMEINEKGDTTWVRRAEKLFSGVEEINAAYAGDSGCNREFSRSAAFRKSFRWFNTGFRFSETINKVMTYGEPINNYLNSEELRFFFSSYDMQEDLQHGPDSLKYKVLNDSVRHKSEIWLSNASTREWIGNFSRLTSGKAPADMLSKLKSQQQAIAGMVREKYDKNFDSLWKEGVILKEFIGEENAVKFQAEADSALTIVAKELFTDFKDYSVRIVMPGKLTGTNGFIDSSKVLIWPVGSDYFLTQPYEMWAESKVTNVWAWIVSGFFLLFVLTGVIIKIKKG
jgi:hypothetical protein